jgi:hypothetical protein
MPLVLYVFAFKIGPLDSDTLKHDLKELSNMSKKAEKDGQQTPIHTEVFSGE